MFIIFWEVGAVGFISIFIVTLITMRSNHLKCLEMYNVGNNKVSFKYYISRFSVILEPPHAGLASAKSTQV